MSFQRQQLPIVAASGVTDLRSNANIQLLLERLDKLEKAVNKNPIFAGVAEVEYGGVSPNSGLTAVTTGAKGTSAIYLVTPIESYGNNRFGVVVNPTPTKFEVYLVSTVGNPPGGTREKVYWLALTG